MTTIVRIAVMICAIVACASSQAGEVRVAVASNFQLTAQTLAEVFQRQSNHTVLIIPGSTGRLYAQILHGAPFDVFLSADQLRPELLFSNGRTQRVKTYAVGELVLMVASELQTVSTPEDISTLLQTHRVAIADASVAPYGVAALQVFETFGLTPEELDLVQGESVGQVASFLSSGNIQVGLVARSQYVQGLGQNSHQFAALTGRYDEIRQDAALISETRAAIAFFDFLSSSDASDIITEHGYQVIE